MSLNGPVLIRRWRLFEPGGLLEEMRYLQTESNCGCSNLCEYVKPSFWYLKYLAYASHPSEIEIMRGK